MHNSINYHYYLFIHTVSIYMFEEKQRVLCLKQVNLECTLTAEYVQKCVCHLKLIS